MVIAKKEIKESKGLLEVRQPYLNEVIDIITSMYPSRRILDWLKVVFWKVPPGYPSPKPFLEDIIRKGQEKDKEIHEHFEKKRFEEAKAVYSNPEQKQVAIKSLSAQLKTLEDSLAEIPYKTFNQLWERAKGLFGEHSYSYQTLNNVDKFASKVSSRNEALRFQAFIDRLKKRLPEEKNLENRVNNLRSLSPGELISTFSNFCDYLFAGGEVDHLLEDIFRLSIGDVRIAEKLGLEKEMVISKGVKQESTHGWDNFRKLTYGQEDKAVLKMGFDPTDPEIHLGHSVGLKLSRKFQEMGYYITIIIGDRTATIGDPSGKSETRKQLSIEDIMKNTQNFKEQILKFLDPEKTNFVPNSIWLSILYQPEMDKLIYSRINVKQLLSRGDFRARLASPDGSLSLLELKYQVYQGLDSVVLDADIEMGGDDQRLNTLFARDLQRMLGEDPQLIILVPLLPGTDGIHKMSKSMNNYISVNASAEEMFKQLIELPDWVVRTYFTLLTDLLPKQINDYMKYFDERKLLEDWGTAIAREYKLEPLRTSFTRTKILEFMSRTPTDSEEDRTLDCLKPLLLDLETALKAEGEPGPEYQVTIGADRSFMLHALNKYTRELFSKMGEVEPADDEKRTERILEVKGELAKNITKQYHDKGLVEKVAKEFYRTRLKHGFPKEMKEYVLPYPTPPTYSVQTILQEAADLSRRMATKRVKDNAVRLYIPAQQKDDGEAAYTEKRITVAETDLHIPSNSFVNGSIIRYGRKEDNYIRLVLTKEALAKKTVTYKEEPLKEAV